MLQALEEQANDYQLLQTGNLTLQKLLQLWALFDFLCSHCSDSGIEIIPLLLYVAAISCST